MDPMRDLERALLVEGGQDAEARSYSSDELELIVAESCEAAFRTGWAEGYAVGGRWARPVLGVPRRELEKWLARGLMAWLGVTGALWVTDGLLVGG